jgi:hypothetical protein
VNKIEMRSNGWSPSMTSRRDSLGIAAAGSALAAGGLMQVGV